MTWRYERDMHSRQGWLKDIDAEAPSSDSNPSSALGTELPVDVPTVQIQFLEPSLSSQCQAIWSRSNGQHVDQRTTRPQQRTKPSRTCLCQVPPVERDQLTVGREQGTTSIGTASRGLDVNEDFWGEGLPQLAVVRQCFRRRPLPYQPAMRRWHSEQLLDVDSFRNLLGQQPRPVDSRLQPHSRDAIRQTLNSTTNSNWRPK